jgi:hypothetical protein
MVGQRPRHVRVGLGIGGCLRERDAEVQCGVDGALRLPMRLAEHRSIQCGALSDLVAVAAGGAASSPGFRSGQHRTPPKAYYKRSHAGGHFASRPNRFACM